MSFHTKNPRRYGNCSACGRYGQVTAAGYMFKHKCKPQDAPDDAAAQQEERTNG